MMHRIVLALVLSSGPSLGAECPVNEYHPWGISLSVFASTRAYGIEIFEQQTAALKAGKYSPMSDASGGFIGGPQFELRTCIMIPKQRPLTDEELLRLRTLIK